LAQVIILDEAPCLMREGASMTGLSGSKGIWKCLKVAEWLVVEDL